MSGYSSQHSRWLTRKKFSAIRPIAGLICSDVRVNRRRISIFRERQQIHFKPGIASSASRCCARTDAAAAARPARAGAPKTSRQFMTVSVSEPRAGIAHVPGLRVEADGQHQLDLRHQPPSAARARPARIRGAAAGRRPWHPGRESRTPSARWRSSCGRRTRRRDTPSQPRSRSPEASVNGMPERCTLVPGAWLAIRMRAVRRRQQHRPRLVRQRTAERRSRRKCGRRGCAPRQIRPAFGASSGGGARPGGQRAMPAQRRWSAPPAPRCAPAS